MIDSIFADEKEGHLTYYTWYRVLAQVTNWMKP